MRSTIAKVQKATNTAVSLKDAILAVLDDNKAEDIAVIELAGKSDMADCMIIASGRSNRHVSAISENLVHALKTQGFGTFQVEGSEECNWVLVDALDIIVHLFCPETRGFYNLEKMWQAILPERVEG